MLVKFSKYFMWHVMHAECMLPAAQKAEDQRTSKQLLLEEGYKRLENLEEAEPHLARQV